MTDLSKIPALPLAAREPRAVGSHSVLLETAKLILLNIHRNSTCISMNGKSVAFWPMFGRGLCNWTGGWVWEMSDKIHYGITQVKSRCISPQPCPCLWHRWQLIEPLEPQHRLRKTHLKFSYKSKGRFRSGDGFLFNTQNRKNRLLCRNAISCHWYNLLPNH